MENKKCVNCIYLKNEMCEELKKMIYPDYEINDNTDFYLNGFDIHNPEKFGCALFCCKNQIRIRENENI